MRGERIEVRPDNPLPLGEALGGWARERGVKVTDLEVRQRTLEDVYLELTASQ